MTGAECDELMACDWTLEQYVLLLAAVMQQARHDLQNKRVPPLERDKAAAFIQAMQDEFTGVNSWQR